MRIYLTSVYEGLPGPVEDGGKEESYDYPNPDGRHCFFDQ
jgi:hypothetical protein